MFTMLLFLSCLLMASLAAAGLLLSAEEQVEHQAAPDGAEPPATLP